MKVWECFRPNVSSSDSTVGVLMLPCRFPGAWMCVCVCGSKVGGECVFSAYHYASLKSFICLSDCKHLHSFLGTDCVWLQLNNMTAGKWKGKQMVQSEALHLFTDGCDPAPRSSSHEWDVLGFLYWASHPQTLLFIYLFLYVRFSCASFPNCIQQTSAKLLIYLKKKCLLCMSWCTFWISNCVIVVFYFFIL